MIRQKKLAILKCSKFMKIMGQGKNKTRAQSPRRLKRNLESQFRSSTQGLSKNLTKLRSCKPMTARFTSKRSLGPKARVSALTEFSKKKHQINNLGRTSHNPLKKKTVTGLSNVAVKLKVNNVAPKRKLSTVASKPKLGNMSTKPKIGKKKSQTMLKIGSNKTVGSLLRVPRFRPKVDMGIPVKKLKIKIRGVDFGKMKEVVMHSPKNGGEDKGFVQPRSKSQGLRFPQNSLFGMKANKGSTRLVGHANTFSNRNKPFSKRRICDYTYRNRE